MPVDIEIRSDAPLHGVNRQWLEHSLERMLSYCGLADQRVSLLIVADSEMAELNRQYRQKDTPTNVLSFPLHGDQDIPFTQLGLKELGDIVISSPTAMREAIELGHTFRQRLSWLLAHGLLHLLGYDHERGKQDQQKMEAKEQELLKAMNIFGRPSMTQLAINVDHVATIRQARGINQPDPVTAAAICELAGACGIVVHLREDRRHIQDRDVVLLRQTVKSKLNLEMGANEEIITFALDLKPDLITLVPEKRQELTTEGGLNVAGQKKKIGKVIERMAQAGIPVSIFADPDQKQLKAAADIGAVFVELHTGRYCDATTEEAMEHEYRLIAEAADYAHGLGLRVCAGHGLDYNNTAAIAALAPIEELSIGHAIISRAVFSGLDQAVREMLAIIRQAGRYN